MRLNLSDARSINQQLSFLREFSSPMWDSARVADVFYVKGRIGWRGLRRSDFTVDGPYLITGMHIRGGRVRWEECFHIPEAKFNESPEIIVQEGDIVITKDGTIGKVAFIDSLPGAASLNSHLFLVRPKTKIINRNFAYHVFSSFLFEKFVDEQSSGSTLTGLPESRFLNFCFPLPPLHEQLSIAAVLDMVDEAIAKTEAVIAKLKQVRAGLLHDLLTRGLDENGQLRDPIVQPEQFQDSPLGRIPREWSVGSFREFGKSDRAYLKTGPFGSSLKQEHWVSEGVPVVTGSLGEGEFIVSEILHVSDETARVLAAYSLLPGDIVFSRVADVGRSVVVTEAERGWIMSSNMMWISLDPKKADPHYTQLNISANAMVRSQIERLVNSAGREVANAAVMNSLTLPWASHAEQKRILRVLRAGDAYLAQEQVSLKKLYLLKSGLMNDLLTGRVRVPEGISVTG